MRILAKLVKWLLLLVVVTIVGAAGWLYIAPPDLIRVGTGYAAKIVCSNVFIAGRDADEVLKVDVQAPGHPILKLLNVSVDRAGNSVSAGLFGIFGESVAIARGGLGCTSVPDGDVAAASAVTLAAEMPAARPDALWPEGERVEPAQTPAIRTILDDTGLTGPGMRAVVVVKDGRIVGERYGAGFSEKTPLLGWSMTKTVTAALIGTLVHDGRIAVDEADLLEEWSVDGRAQIKLSDLMSMSSGLEFNEDYGDVTDVTRMLYLQPDMAAFAADKPQAHPLGTVFNYSSGTTTVASRIWQSTFDSAEAALGWPRQALFGPLGMDSAVMEADASGTFVGSSYLYATGRDWARFGQFLLQQGKWKDQQILPEGFVRWMTEAAPASKGEYGRGFLWLQGPRSGVPAGQNPDTVAGLPEDTYWLRGHDGQTVAVVPSQNLVVVRLGLTPSKLAYRPQALAAALSKAF